MSIQTDTANREAREEPAPEIVWAGRPYQGLFLSPEGWVSVVASGALVGLLAIGTLVWGVSIWAPITTGGLIGLATCGQMIADKRLRQHLRYELRRDGLKIIKCSEGCNSVLRTVCVQQLSNVKPDWPGRIASISLPPRPQDVYDEIFNEWTVLVPACRPSAKLVLVEGASEVAAMLERISRSPG